MTLKTETGDQAACSPPAATLDDARSVLPFCIVGIGASAGGLEAAKELLAALSPNTGFAFMLILHLPPQHESMLSEILARVSRVPVLEVKDGVAIAPNH